ncbi:MAG: FAD:protein FMN transferase, partial [Erysipelotrichaceae bacterium]
SLIGYTDSQETFDEYFAYVCEQFMYYDQLFDIYDSYDDINNMKTINDQAGIAPVEVDQAIIDLLLEAQYFESLSNHEFDVTFGAVFKVWHSYRELANENDGVGNIPEIDELNEAQLHTGMDKLIINDEANTVYLTDENASLDVGGIAKGFAAEAIAQGLMDLGLDIGIVDAGGNNRIIGSKPDGELWKVGIQNPNGNGSLVIVSSDVEMSFVTSGDYQRYYVDEQGNRYHHIIDPSTLYPATHYRSVSIITDDSGQADALSTSLFTLGFEEGLALIDEYRALGYTIEVIWITSLDETLDYPNSIHTDEFNIYYTDGLIGKLSY